MVLGESGTGKSASMRTLNPKDVGIFNVGGKPLPFKNAEMAKRCVNTDSMSKILELLPKVESNILVIDDAQYLMANQFMRMANVNGFQKFTDIQKAFWDIVQMVNQQLPPEKIVYFFMHVERDANGHEKAKTIGKMLDEKITLEGMFTVVLKTCVQDGKYTFSTQNSGQDTVKTPIGMFSEAMIPNDLLFVDTTIRAYYGLTEGKEDKKGKEKAE
jgi:hypothetical protein